MNDNPCYNPSSPPGHCHATEKDGAAYSQSAQSERTEPTPAIPTGQQQLLNLETVARRLAISKTSVYRMVARKLLPCYRLGGLLRFAEEDIEMFLRISRVG